MKKILFVFLMLLIATIGYSQEYKKHESKFHLGIDFQSKYIWRGMEMMTSSSAPVVFPQINYQNKGVYAYVMGGYSINGKYSEVDLGVSYTYKWLTVGVNNYYYPSTTTAEDKYFNFKSNGTGHWFEGVVTIAPESIPAYLTVSNFFAGTDKKANDKQAYSTYVEIGGHYDFLYDHSLALAVGASFNKSCYNGYEHDFSICNIEFKYTYNLTFRKSTLPLSVAYIINPVYEKAHVNFTASFAF
ncbi:MAG: hypothetical protein J1F40_04100 [Prevotellaceae bacterium]|nr:hypothetical protein [Prevotellaceae bacterium]